MEKNNKHKMQDESHLSENPIQSLISEQPGHQKHSGYLQQQNMFMSLECLSILHMAETCYFFNLDGVITPSNIADFLTNDQSK